MKLLSAKKRIQLFKKLICGTNGLHYFHKKRVLDYTCTVGNYFEKVWDQFDTPYCMCYAAAQMVTILYRMHRPEECKSLILSPQTLLNLGCQYVDRLRVFLTESVYGLYDIEAQPFHYLCVKKPESLAKSNKPYLIKDLAIYRTKETILKVLISNFRERGPQYPMLGACNMH
ncbi:hypothetical protein HanIR_Chr02g0067471 [Helianthus annuus]|nr:hypothetical protein HanIR_Chr02g0067471 [Helianthus annuus]